MNKGIGFASLLAVIGVSIVFGMLIGGKLNAPQPMFASETAERQTGESSRPPVAPVLSFADVVDGALPAVVGITSRFEPETTRQFRHPESLEEFWRWFSDPETIPDSEPRQEPRTGAGSGFILTPDGYILTNNHVVEDASQVMVSMQEGRELVAEIVGTDPLIDLALLKVDAGERELPTLPLGDSDDARVGEWVIAIGNPIGLEQSVTVGVLSAKKRRIPIGGIDQGGLVTFLQTDAAINFGNSGGPLLDGAGGVIGINVAIQRGSIDHLIEGMGFALPINQARAVVDQLRERGYVKRGYLGISMSTAGIDDDARDYLGLPDSQGVVVEDVTPDGPADEAGVRPDDVIRKVDGEIVLDNDDLIARISARQPGERVKLQIYRDGGTRNVTATLGERLQSMGLADDESPRREVEEPKRESEGLGITVEDLRPERQRALGLDDEQRGVVVVDVEFGSLAEQKGIIPGMLIMAINSEEIHSVSDWDEAISGLQPGSAVKLNTLYRTATGPRHFTIFLRAPEGE
jgi:serine protease Do